MSGELTVGIHGNDGLHRVSVTKQGELITGKLSYSTPYYVQIIVADTAYEVVVGKAGKQFVITDILLSSDKDFGSSVAGADITVYGAHPSDIDTALNTVANIELLRNDRLVATGLNLITDTACSIVAIATDTVADITIAGYYIDA